MVTSLFHKSNCLHEWIIIKKKVLKIHYLPLSNVYRQSLTNDKNGAIFSFIQIIKQTATMLGLVVIAICLLASAASTKPSFCHDLDCPNYTVLRSFGVSFIIKRDMFHIIYHINCICFAEKKFHWSCNKFNFKFTC